MAYTKITDIYEKGQHSRVGTRKKERMNRTRDYLCGFMEPPGPVYATDEIVSLCDAAKYVGKIAGGQSFPRSFASRIINAS